MFVARQVSLPSPYTLQFNIKFRKKSISPLYAKPLIPKPNLCSFKILNCFLSPPLTPKKPHTNFLKQSLRSINAVKPYLLSRREAILKGWLCSFVSVLALSKIVPKVGKFSSILTKTDATRLRNEGLLLGVLVMVRLIGIYWQQAFLWDATLNAVYRIRVDVFQKVLERDMGFFEGASGVSAGDIAYRITAEASDVADTVYSLLNTIIPSTLQLTAMATQMLVISPLLSFISALIIPCMGVVIAYLGEKLRRISKKANLSISTLSVYLNEVLPAILFVKASNAERHECTRFQRLAHADLSKLLKKKKMKVLIPEVVQMIYFGSLFIFCMGSLMVSSGSFNGCSMVSFITSLVLLIEPIQGVGKAYNELKQGEPAIDRLFELTRFKSKVIENPNAVDLATVTGEAGETVALVGPSGGGKTTLVKLLLRLYDPLSGYILLDNHNIQTIQLESLRRHIGFVSQDIMLFTGTVAENIGYRDLMDKIDMERVEHAAKTANADEFIRSLPEGYKTNIGPRGSLLSGGQRQRLAIARALYQSSSILILDEATSALDSRSELLVRQAVQRLMENHTVLVIAHRLETVRMARRVLLLENGKLELTHSSLLDDRPDSLASTGLVI